VGHLEGAGELVSIGRSLQRVVDVLRASAEFRDASGELLNSKRSQNKVPGDSQVTDRHRDAKWISKATAGSLDSGILLQMINRKKLARSLKLRGQWLHDIDEVAKHQPTYARVLTEACDENHDFKTKRKR
jgi:hypothetical protein